MSVQGDVNSLIEGLQKLDPRLYQALQLLNSRLGDIDRELHPPIRIAEEIAPITYSDAILAPTDFTAITTGRTVRFSWTQSVGAFFYEIRKGTSWDTATFVTRMVGLSVDIDPLLEGSHSYLIKAANIANVYSSSTSSLTFVVTEMTAVSISPRVIDNNVLLYWSEPITTFDIDYYIVGREGAEFGTTSSTFMTIFEQVPGTYTYSITPVDIAGNQGQIAYIDVFVNQPPDYALTDRRVSLFDYNALDNVIIYKRGEGGYVLVCCWEDITYEEHFVDNSWDSPQEQIDAGYPIYIQPGVLTGYYEEIFNYGIALTNIIVSIYWTQTNLGTDTMGIVVKMATSLDGTTYSAFTSGATQFFPTFQYLKFKLEFTAPTDQAMIELYNLTVTIDVKRENDGGQIAALSTDATGTVVLFNKPFKDIESLTATVRSTTVPYVVVIDFVDAPNPTQFKVYVYDAAGARVSKTIDWKARGIL